MLTELNLTESEKRLRLMGQVQYLPQEQKAKINELWPDVRAVEVRLREFSVDAAKSQ